MIITKSQLRQIIREEVQKVREAKKAPAKKVTKKITEKNPDDNFIVKYDDKKDKRSPAAIAHDKMTKKSTAQKKRRAVKEAGPVDWKGIEYDETPQMGHRFKMSNEFMKKYKYDSARAGSAAGDIADKFGKEHGLRRFSHESNGSDGGEFLHGYHPSHEKKLGQISQKFKQHMAKHGVQVGAGSTYTSHPTKGAVKRRIS